MTTFGMFTHEGNLALAAKLNEALPDIGGITPDEAYEHITSLIKADTEFCQQHNEWSDTAVREAVYAWIESPRQFRFTDESVTVTIDVSLHLTVPTLDGDARSVLTKQDEDISELVGKAMEDAIREIEERLGVTVSEWSGVNTNI